MADHVGNPDDCNWHNERNITYASDAESVKHVNREAELLRANGVDASVETLSMPWGVHPAVIATGLPFLDRGLHFARTVPSTSYVVGVKVEQLPPTGMYLNTSDPVRSVRLAEDADCNTIVLVGGKGHSTVARTETLQNHRTLVDPATDIRPRQARQGRVRGGQTRGHRLGQLDRT